MGKIYVGGEYLSIPRYHCIAKAQIKVSGTVDYHDAHDFIGGCDVTGWL